MRFIFDAGVIIYKYMGGERHFLLLGRKEGWLDTPKGQIRKGENSREAALREAHEETGLFLNLDPYFKDEIDYWYVQDKEKIKKHVVYYLAEAPKDARVRVSSEHVNYEWVEASRGKISQYKNVNEVIRNANDYIEKLELIGGLNEEYKKLPETRRGWKLSNKFVPGDGPVNAKVMVVGQAPGRTEDEQGKPFVGMAGQLLKRLLRKAGLKRDRVYITSVVQFFPPGNRVPTEGETALCLPFLKRQIAIIKPKIIVLLGNFAAKNVAGVEEVMKNHGKLSKSKEYGCYLYTTLHPAAAVRIKKHTPILEEDFANLKELMKYY